MARLSAGAYIFTDHDRLSVTQRELATAIWKQLEAHPKRVRLLNDPSRVLSRYELICELSSNGQNHYRARRPGEGLDSLRYPVFIRAERGHDGSITPLLHSAAAVHRALIWTRILGFQTQELLIVEFCDTSDGEGLFRKYSAFMVGDDVLPRHLLFSRNWQLKQPDITNADTERETQVYIERNPHRDTLRDIFRRAGVDYGRIDYSILEKKLQVWEINTNPMVRKLASPLTEAFSKLDERFSADLEPIPIHLDSDLIGSAEFEARVEAAAARRRTRIANRLEAPFPWLLRTAGQLLLPGRSLRPSALDVRKLRGSRDDGCFKILS